MSHCSMPGTRRRGQTRNTEGKASYCISLIPRHIFRKCSTLLKSRCVLNHCALNLAKCNIFNNWWDGCWKKESQIENSRLWIICFLKLLIFVCAGSSLLCALFSSWGELGLLFTCGARASHCGGFSCCRARALGHVSSVVLAPGL